MLGLDSVSYVGVAAHVAAGLWNVWPKRALPPAVCALLAALLLGGCGPITAPPGAADLRQNPKAFSATFDRDVGQHRLLLLLSPG